VSDIRKTDCVAHTNMARSLEKIRNILTTPFTCYNFTTLTTMSKNTELAKSSACDPEESHCCNDENEKSTKWKSETFGCPDESSRDKGHLF